MVTFSVSEVERATEPLEEVEPRVAIESLACGAVEAWWRPATSLAREWTYKPTQTDYQAMGAYHPFFAAVHAAFDRHRPLVLSPDSIWLMIAQGFATHVQENAELLRSRLVTHEGREVISVRRDDFVKGDPGNPWPDVFAALSDQVSARFGELGEVIVADFSTTDPTTRAATQLALLSTASPYFAYQLHSLCGIPEITLTGTVDDWRAVRRRAGELARYELGWWVDALVPVLDELVSAANGRSNLTFWRSFYKHLDGSGGPYLTGWINALLPYTQRDGKPCRNPWVARWKEGMSQQLGGGPTTEGLPSGISRVPFLWKYFHQEYRMEFLGGFAGVGQDRSTLAVHPAVGWAVREAS